MKKFMFSAVALVAFSFAGMANTGGEDKLVEKKISNEHTILSPGPLSVCNSIAYDTYHMWIGYGASDEMATKKAENAKIDCINELTKAE